MNILQKIIQNKKQELEQKKSNWEKFRKIFSEKKAGIIAEIKIASPKYDYSDKINVEKVFRFYGENNKIKAVSNLIDEKYFKWDIRRGTRFKEKYNKPIFFKEFVVSKTQIDGAAYGWYDTLLLLARVLDRKKLIEFIFYTNSKNIFPIVEIDCEEDMKMVVKLLENMCYSPSLQGRGLGGRFWIAINCRNLWTMEIDRRKHFSLIKNYEEKLENTLVFAFSWIDDLEQIEEYEWIFNGVLVGGYFMDKLKKNA